MESAISYWPLIVLLIGTLAIVLFIVVFRLHAFISLMFAAILVGILGQTVPEDANV